MNSKTISALILSMSGLIACADAEVNSSAALPSESSGGKISVLFQDFQPGTRCTVSTPEGRLVADTMPGKIDYPSKYRDAKVACSHADGSLYAIDVASSLPETFRVAGFTVYPDGTLAATISTGTDLINDQRSDAVRKIN